MSHFIGISRLTTGEDEEANTEGAKRAVFKARNADLPLVLATERAMWRTACEENIVNCCSCIYLFSWYYLLYGSAFFVKKHANGSDAKPNAAMQLRFFAREQERLHFPPLR